MHPVKRNDQRDLAEPRWHVSAAFPVRNRKRFFDMLEMRAVGGLKALRAANPPHRTLDAIRPSPAFAFVNQLDAVAFLPGLQVKTAGTHFIEQRGKEEKFLFSRLDDENRRIHSSGDKQGPARSEEH